MKSLEDALRLLLEHASPKAGMESIPLESALGRVLAQEVRAPMPLPPFDRSPLDGYALRAQDIQAAAKDAPVTLAVIGEVCAGSPQEYKVVPGQAVRIMTGAPIPDGCDCVIRQEDVAAGEGTVTVFAPLRPSQNVCFMGEDVPKGSLVMEKGRRLNAIALGVLSGLGIHQVNVHPVVTAALLTTGDELAKPGQPLARGAIYDMNGPMLKARLEELGIACLRISAQGDDAAQVARQLVDVLPKVDVVITTGGVSVGNKDILHEVLPLAGAQRLFWGIDMKPGSPMLCGLCQEKLLICLSGNPFAALACFELFTKPALLQMAGDTAPCNRRVHVPLKGSFSKPSPSRRLIRAYFDGAQVHTGDSGHSSGSLAAMLGCNCLIDIPAGQGALAEGALVEIVLL